MTLIEAMLAGPLRFFCCSDVSMVRNVSIFEDLARMVSLAKESRATCLVHSGFKAATLDDWIEVGTKAVSEGRSHCLQPMLDCITPACYSNRALWSDLAADGIGVNIKDSELHVLAQGYQEMLSSPQQREDRFKTLGHFCAALECVDLYTTLKMHYNFAFVCNCHAAVIKVQERYKQGTDFTTIQPEDIAAYTDLETKMAVLEKESRNSNLDAMFTRCNQREEADRKTSCWSSPASSCLQ